MKGLIIKKHWLDLVLSGQKPWEIRGSKTSVHGTICLIESGSGLIKGTVEVNSCIKPLSVETLKQTRYLHCIDDLSIIKYKTPYAWQMNFPVRFDNPIPYKHPRGAVIWVNLPDDILEGLKV